jgi:hypothetical protein
MFKAADRLCALTTVCLPLVARYFLLTVGHPSFEPQVLFRMEASDPLQALARRNLLRVRNYLMSEQMSKASGALSGEREAGGSTNKQQVTSFNTSRVSGVLGNRAK